MAWADSPNDAPLHNVAADAAAPPSLRRVASREAHEGGAPKLTRSVTSYIREIAGDGDRDGLSGMSSSPLVPADSSMHAPASSRQPSISAVAAPSISRNPSIPNLGGRSVSSFIKDFIDTSAQLEAPPMSAVPPPLAPSLRVGSISDFLK